MQKGKVLHRRCIGDGARILSAVVIVVELIINSLPTNSTGRTFWIDGRGKTAIPTEESRTLYGTADSVFFGILSNTSNPYSLRGLISTSIRLGRTSPRSSVWACWSITDHTIFRSDRMELIVGGAPLSKKLYISMKPSIERISIEGFRPEGSMTCSASIALVLPGCFAVEFEGGLEDFRTLKIGESSQRYLLEIGRVLLAFNRISGGGRRNRSRMGIEVEMSEGICLLSGYELYTGEVSFGMSLCGKWLALGLTWSYHPALGRTFSFGVGRLWWR